MQKLRQRIIIKSLSAAGLLSLVFFSMHKGLAALGILCGALTAIACFQLLAGAILVSPYYALEKIKPYFFLKYLTRYAIMGVVLFWGARIGLNFFLGAAGGLLLIYLVIFLEAL